MTIFYFALAVILIGGVAFFLTRGHLKSVEATLRSDLGKIHNEILSEVRKVKGTAKK